MEASCPACSTRYLVSDDRVRGKTARMRCKNCQTVWMVTGPMGGADLSATGGRAAVIRRGAERERRDLFATQPPDHGSVKQTMRPPAPNTPNYGFSTAGRNENSVLFTVDELKRAAGTRVKTPEPVQVAPSAPQDDSGVIDLKALSHAPPPPAGPLTPPMLFSEPPPGAFAVDASGPSPAVQNTASKKWIALTGVAAAAIMLLGVGVAAIAFRGAEPVNRLAAVPPPAVSTVAPAAPETPAPAAAADTSDAKSPSVGTSTTASATKGKRGKGKWSRGRGHAAKGKHASAAKPKAAPKAADPCHCKGDFTCILRCTAKGK